MSKLWRGAGAIVIVILSLIGCASAASAGTSCAPGQHGNPHPGFKPGSC